MNTSYAWQVAFPIAHVQTVIKHVCDTWQWVTHNRSEQFQYKFREPKITQRFSAHLIARSLHAGLTGRWGCENLELDLDPENGKVNQTQRTDLNYFSDASNPVLNLTFEFKKLNNTNKSLRAYYGSDGMGRFVYGKYGQGEPLGFMVGILKEPDPACVIALKYALGQSVQVSALNLLDDPPGVWVRQPSIAFPRNASFDTHHQRPAKAPICLVHLILTF